jgi:hypothetical protein
MSKTPVDLNKHTIIYSLTDPNTKQIRYIGKTVKLLNIRLTDHIYSIKRETNYRTNWIKSLLNKNQKPIIEELDSCKWNQSQQLEQYWISQFKTWGFDLVNFSDGGESFMLGKKHSKESRQKMSLSQLGKKKPSHSEETKQKLSKATKLHIALFGHPNKKPPFPHLILNGVVIRNHTNSYKKYHLDNKS